MASPTSKLGSGTQAVVDSRPEPKDLSHHLSRATKARQASSIKSFYKYFAIPGIGQVAGGLPSNYYFPFDTLEAKVARPNRWQPTPNRPVDPPPEDEKLAQLTLADWKSNKPEGSPLNQPQDAIVVPHTSQQQDVLKKIDLSTALQYGTAEGYPPLYYFVREFSQNHVHINCPYKGGPEVIMTCGNTDGFSKSLMALSNEWSEEKDWIRDREGILVEHYTYMNAVQAAKPRGLSIVPVEIDDEGMRADGKGGLEDVLKNWDFTKGKRPHLMYTVTMGQNPTSGVLSLQRRKEIYALCSKYDVIIIEDDPYWYLQFPSSTAKNTTTTADCANTSFNPDVAMFANAEPRPEGWKSSGYEFLDSLVPSSISIDTDGRVIRLDTFSKTMAPGTRLGWINAQPALVERMLRVTETSTQQPSGFVQSMVAELLLGPDHSGLEEGPTTITKRKDGRDGLPNGQGWKFDGWVRWLEGLRGNYERRMKHMSQVLEDGKYFVKSGRRKSLADHVATDLDDNDNDGWSVVEKTQMLAFEWPVGGMFIWLRILFENHPLYSTYKKSSPDGLARLSHALWYLWTTKPYRVLVSPGNIFSATEEINARDGWKNFRLCFAAINEDELGPTTQRLVDGVEAFWKIKDKRVIEDLLKEDERLDVVSTRAGLAEMAYMMGPC